MATAAVKCSMVPESNDMCSTKLTTSETETPMLAGFSSAPGRACNIQLGGLVHRRDLGLIDL